MHANNYIYVACTNKTLLFCTPCKTSTPIFHRADKEGFGFICTLLFIVRSKTNYPFSWKVYSALLITFKFAGFWNQAGIWNVIGKNSTVLRINNTSESKLLGHYESDKVELCNKCNVKNLWKIGTVDNNGYFNLTHLESEKLLTATSSPSNTLKVYKSM